MCFKTFSPKSLLFLNLSDDINIKLNCIAFKQGLVAASAKTAYQAVPELSLVDTWILCKQVVDILKTDYGKTQLGENYMLAYNKPSNLNRNSRISINPCLKKIDFWNYNLL